MKDQGAQFTSDGFTNVLKANQIQISMDGKGRWLDNRFTERLWRSVKYECVYLNEWTSVSQARNGLKEYFNFYNYVRPHQRLNGLTPYQVHSSQGDGEKLFEIGSAHARDIYRRDSSWEYKNLSNRSCSESRHGHCLLRLYRDTFKHR